MASSEPPDPATAGPAGSRPTGTLPTRCGYVALLGPPNAGKSTLLNRLLGEPLSIVTPKAQTTWRPVTGILTSDRHQLVFLDTPGVLSPRDLLHRSFLASVRRAVSEADVAVLVVDAAAPADQGLRERLLDTLSGSAASRVGAVNKVDRASEASVERERAWLEREAGAPGYPISATDGRGVGALLRAVEERLPESPFLFPEDEIATEPVRFFVAEMVRETIFLHFREEVPYSTFCKVEEFREGEDPVYIQVHIYVERPSQKGILIGEKGTKIRTLGTEARKRIEAFLGRRVYLDLWVKVLPGWRRKRGHLRRFGFTVPDDERDAKLP